MSRDVMQQALEALDDAMQMLLPKSQSDKARRAAYALRAALAEQKCPCGDRPADRCPGEWEPGCDLGANEKHVKVAEPERGPGWCDIHQHYKPCEHNTAQVLDSPAPVGLPAGEQTGPVAGGSTRAEQAQPVAWKHRDHREILDADPREWGRADEPWIPLYTTPPAPVVPQPLTDEDIHLITGHCGVSKHAAISIARAVEAEVRKRLGV